MIRKNPLVHAIAVAGLSASAMALSNAVIAQEETVELEEIVVTGSRIQKANLVASSPVTPISSEEIKFQGAVRIEDMLRTVPAIWSDQNTGQSNGATGTATLNLRNLGEERTLVLVNGRRMPAGSPLSGGIAPDINQVPGALVESIEVLTGGASAIYGSDAVAGVVNFKMKQDFEGFEFDVQHSFYRHENDSSQWQGILDDGGYPTPSGTVTDGDTTAFSLIVGGNFDDGRGNVTAYATYRDIKQVVQADRDYSACALSTESDFCFGSGTIPQGRVTDFGIQDDFDFIVDGTDFVDRQGETFNYGALNYFQRPDERLTFGTFAHYDINDSHELYTEVMYMDTRTVSQIAPSGAFFVTDSLNCGNPLLSDQQFEQLCGQFGLTEDDTQFAYVGKRNIEGGNRQQDLRHTSHRFVFGGRGQINEAISYDVSYMFSEVSMENTYLNDLSTTRITRALDAVEDDDGNIVCRSVLEGYDTSCVPWNLFETGAVTQEQLDYLVLPLFARGTTDQSIFSGYISADLGEYGIQLPSAETGISVVVGFETRDEELDFNPDVGFLTGDGAGQGGATNAVEGGISVEEFFMEANVPLIEGMAFVDSLSLDISMRNGDYEVLDEGAGSFDADAYGIGLGWQVNDSLKLRASTQRAVRAPNIRELFLPQGLNLTDFANDPCGGPVVNGISNGGGEDGFTLEECTRSGITAEQFGSAALTNPAGQYNYRQGGNLALEAEVADTNTFGIVWTPEFISGLSLTLDYYDIQITDGIDNIEPLTKLELCLKGNLELCEDIQRGDAGDLWIGSNAESSGQVIALLDNLAIENVEGYDLIIDYDIDIGDMGSLSFNNVTSYISKWDKQEVVGTPVIDCKGVWGSSCGYPTPDFKNNLRTTWITPWDVTATLMWRYIDEVKDANGNGQHLDTMNYFDLAAVWDINENFTFRAGINNVLDEEPPIGGAAAGSSINGNGNTFPGMYDALGQYLFTGLTVKF